jgi:hypothetical protein
MNQKMVTDFWTPQIEHVDSEKRWPKLTDFQTFLGYFHVFHVVEHIRNILTTNIVKNETFSKKSKKSIFGQFLPISATFYEVKTTF